MVFRAPADLDEAWLSLAAERGGIVEIGRPLGVRTCGEFLETQRRALKNAAPSLMPPEASEAKGIWVARGARVHPGARLVGPVFIGENSEVGAGCVLGPNVALGADCILAPGCRLENAAIFSGTYVGDGLTLSEVVVDRGVLVNAARGNDVLVTDDGLLGDMSRSRLRVGLSSAFQRMIAFVLMAASAPWIVAARRRARRGGTEVMRLPASAEHLLGPTFTLRWPEQRRGPLHDALHRILPSLGHVVAGRMDLFGVPPRTRQEVRALPPALRAMYLRSRVGLISVRDTLADDPTLSPEDVQAAEAAWCVAPSPRRELTLLGGWLRTLRRGT
ncbi:MAG: hypothetical protein FJX76_23550 [Armatimonadetes bacterium]|nr:hypothetical protein [Armatimonadota bacterium]